MAETRSSVVKWKIVKEKFTHLISVRHIGGTVASAKLKDVQSEMS
jgi:hypothetical protein